MGNMHRSFRNSPALPAALAALVALALSSGGLAGCAAGPGKKPPSERKSGSQAVKVSEAGELSGLAGAIKTEEDRLILDLLLDYRQLALAAPGPGTLDKATRKRGRDAYERLESILRHGGVKAGDDGERIYTITDEEKLSLQEVMRSAEKAASQAAREGDWDKARARWKEISQSKPAITRAMEEAGWGLALSDALQSSLPDSSKRRLKNLNDSYVAEAAADEIGRQVKAILETGPEVRLQRELKKLANRAWERDKKAGRLPAAETAGAEAAAMAGLTSGGDELPPPPAGAGDAPAAESQAESEADSRAAAAEADSLAAKGKYVAALKALERAGDQPWAKEKKKRFGEQFCEEKRRSAANSFMEFKKARTAAAQRAQLARTASDLDSCLFYFPDLSVTQKVRKNREMVEGELKKLKP